MTLRTDAVPLPYGRSRHLVDVIAETERLAALVLQADADRRAELAEELAAECAVASLRLDGSPIDEPPGAAVLEDAGHRPSPTPSRPDRGWASTLRSGRRDLDEPPDEELLALEYLGVRAGLGSDDLAEALLHAPVEALSELHRRVTRGLVPPAEAGHLRHTSQAVHDASVGRIIYYAPDPAHIEAQLNLVGAWLASAAAREHAVVASGILHLELLRLHPFESANGRVARAAARLVLRARGLDPDGLAATELWLVRDALGTYEEVARTMRRRDATIWLERWGEAVAGGLRLAARRLDALDAGVPERAGGFVDARAPGRFTIADYRAEVQVGPEDARGDLHALLDAGRVQRVPGSRGLKYEVL